MPSVRSVCRLLLARVRAVVIVQASADIGACPQAGKSAPTQVAMLAGVTAGLVEATTCMTPMHCIQIKMQQDAMSVQPRFRSTAHAIASIVREEGLKRGLYAGLGPTVLKQAVNSCIRFTSMNELTRLRRQSLGASLPASAPLAVSDTFLCGACAGALSAVISHPIDTIKSNMQGNKRQSDRFQVCAAVGCLAWFPTRLPLRRENVQGMGGQVATPSQSEPYASQGSSLRCLVWVYQTGGIRGLYWGLAPRLLRVTAEQAVTFSVFDVVARTLDNRV
jgi:solute carrier family 25 citrate transporter 1